MSARPSESSPYRGTLSYTYVPFAIEKPDYFATAGAGGPAGNTPGAVQAVRNRRMATATAQGLVFAAAGDDGAGVGDTVRVENG